MAGHVGSTVVLLFCLGALLPGGCKRSLSSGDAVRATLAAIRPQASLPPAAEFAPLGDRWNGEDGVPWAAARSLAQLCKLSYASQAEIDTVLSRWGFGKPSHFQNGSLYACLASDEQTVVIAFRGTDDRQDWLVNADATPQAVLHGTVHRGFYQGMKTLYPQVAAAATDHKAKQKHLWITGHSLGGALAVAFAYQALAEGTFKPAGVVTFGQPLLADSALGAYISGQLGGNYVRFVNERDVVTRVPPGYVHFGKLVWFHEGKVQELDAQRGDSRAAGNPLAGLPPELAPFSPAEFESLQRSIRDLRQFGRTFDPARLQSYGEQMAAVTDHFMDGYLAGIDAFAGSSPRVASR